VALGTLVFIIAAAVLVSAFALGGVAFYPAFRRGVNGAFVVALLVAAAAGGRDWRRRRAARAPDPGTDAPAI
jgi:membrane protein implicated in regulation of membrane protease activity